MTVSRIFTQSGLIGIIVWTAACGAHATPAAPGYITTARPMTILTANDGEWYGAPGRPQPPRPDSITVIRLGPDHPPRSSTIEGTVPVGIMGPPRLAISADGRVGFVTNHSLRDPVPYTIPPEQLANVLVAIDLTTDTLKVIDQVQFDAPPFMALMHPDGRQVIVAVGKGFRIYALVHDKLTLAGEAAAPGFVQSFDVSPRGDRIVAVTMASTDWASSKELHLFELSGSTITHRQRLTAGEGVRAPMDRIFSPRISPDGKTALVPQDLGDGGKGSFDDVLIVDLGRSVPAVTGVIPQVGDGLESIAFHTSGRFAVVGCLEGGSPSSIYNSHVAVIDVTASPPRILSYVPIGLIPEGLEFSPDGTQLFVAITGSNHIVVFDVDGTTLRRSPFVLRTGYAPVALAVSGAK